MLKARNDTGANVRRGEVLEFTDFILTYLEQDCLWFAGAEPDLTNVGWGITLKPIPSTEIDEVLCLGVCIAHVNITDEDHQYANRAAGELVLQSASAGPVKILHKPTGGTPSEERECVVQIMDEIGEGGGLYFASRNTGTPLRSDPLVDEDESYDIDPAVVEMEPEWADMKVQGPPADPDNVGEYTLPTYATGRVLNYTPFGYKDVNVDEPLIVHKSGDLYVVDKPLLSRKQPYARVSISHSRSSVSVPMYPSTVLLTGNSVFNMNTSGGKYYLKLLPKLPAIYQVTGRVSWECNHGHTLTVPIINIAGLDVNTI